MPGRKGEIIFLGVLLLKTRHRLSPALQTFSSVTKLSQAQVLWQGVIWTQLLVLDHLQEPSE